MPSQDDSQHPSRSITHSSLIRGLKDRDDEAWRRLVHLYGPLVFHWCRKLGLRQADSADVMQEVFISVSRAAERFDADRRRGSFRGWLWTITRRKAIDLIRRRPTAMEPRGGTVALDRIMALADPSADATLDDNSDPTDAAQFRSLHQRGLNLVQAEFTTKTWQAFYRTAVQEHATSQVAAELEMSPAAVRKAKSRVLQRLRAVLGENED